LLGARRQEVSMRSILFGLVALAPALASAAGGPPQPGDKHDPALFVDFGSVWINAVSYDNDYSANAAFRIYGASSTKDRARMEWRAGGKIIGTAECTSEFFEKPRTLNAQCSLEKHVSATGPVDVAVIYVDDQTDAEYLVATYHVTVKSWKGIGKTQNFGILPDDALAVAFVRHWYGDTAFHVPIFEFWTTSNKILGDGTMRCTVDGKKLPDFDAHIDTDQGALQKEIEVRVTTPTSNRTYLYEHIGVEPDFHFGSKDDHGIYDPERMRWIIDNPGKWDCMLRKDGHQVRQFTFTVNAKGMVEQSEMQGGKHPIPTLANVVLVDMKIPADNGLELRVRPDAMKKSIGFGVAWPDGARAAELRAALPPASGQGD
jgi:hypothetical protein